MRFPWPSLFHAVWTTSLMACVLIGLILAIRLLLRDRMQPRWTYLLWTLVLLRLVLPWTPESAFSVFNLWTPAHPEASPEPRDTMDRATGQSPAVVFRLSEDSPLAFESPSVQPNRPALQEAPFRSPLVDALSWAWLLGALSAAGIMIGAHLRFVRRLRDEPLISDSRVNSLFRQCQAKMNVRRKVTLTETGLVSSPALTGLFRPRLLMPPDVLRILDDRELQFVFLHELSHLRRRDLFMNAAMHALLALHWFNPLVWYAYRRMREDQELACDALTLTSLRPADSHAYGMTILKLLAALSGQSRFMHAAGIAGSRQAYRRRMILIRTHRPNTYKRTLLGLSVLLLVGGCGLTNAKENAVWGSGKGNVPSDVAQVAVSDGSTQEELASEKGVKLYASRSEEGEVTGIALRTGEIAKTFAWPNLIDQGYKPSLYVADVDGDEREEIVVILKTTNSQGIYHREEIHVLNREDLTEAAIADPVGAVDRFVTTTIALQDGQVEVRANWDDSRIKKTYAESYSMAWNSFSVGFGNIVNYTVTGNVIRAGVSGSLGSFANGTTSYDFHPLTAIATYGPNLQVKNVELLNDGGWTET
ncbi:M56 family metallopeptidase [Cohnella nanjingensis]|uniref:M56 family metallopeptidase n=1 Tax=Cohnella nanjingensis TaxID=1387779 RepID=A0A7X0RU27_9BACL|nr:M56 family metallopeptidase [Cohnella nanjingensis]MBB6673692.1 M56 family metallopeptidase [Cohnella nanjingensis]